MAAAIAHRGLKGLDGWSRPRVRGWSHSPIATEVRQGGSPFAGGQPPPCLDKQATATARYRPPPPHSTKSRDRVPGGSYRAAARGWALGGPPVPRQRAGFAWPRERGRRGRGADAVRSRSDGAGARVEHVAAGGAVVSTRRCRCARSGSQPKRRGGTPARRVNGFRPPCPVNVLFGGIAS